MAPRGIVKPVSVFSPGEIEAAQKQLSRKIKENQENLNNLITYQSDNAELKSLIRHLPDRISHTIMVS
jgi:hypothetical protein